MDIDLPSDATKFIESLVASGEYQSADAAVADGIRLLMTRKQLKEDIQAGIDDLEAGRWVDGKQVFSELRDRARSLENQDG